MRAKYWKPVSAALITCAVSWSALPAAAATGRPGASGQPGGSGQPAAVRLDISPAVQRHLLRLYAAYRHIPVTSVAPAAPGQAVGARLPRTGTDWAMVHWQPSARPRQWAAARFQDGAGTGLFIRPTGGAWRVAGLGGQPVGCAVRVPGAVRRLWHLPGCQMPRIRGPVTAGTRGLVRITLAQVGVADNPPVTSFSQPDCNPYTTLVGNPLGASSSHCKRSSNGSYFQNVQDVSEFWCADFDKWVWEKAGVTSGLGTLTPSAASFYAWGVKHGEHIPFGGTPKVGDAVILYPPNTSALNGTYADHVGIVTAVHSNGTLNLINGDFLGPSNISVQYNANVDISTWASQVEGNQGEKWAFVSPLL